MEWNPNYLGGGQSLLVFKNEGKGMVLLEEERRKSSQLKKRRDAKKTTGGRPRSCDTIEGSRALKPTNLSQSQGQRPLELVIQVDY